MKVNLLVRTAFTTIAMAAAYVFMSAGATLGAEDASLLRGNVVSSAGQALVGIPIKAHLDNSAITVAVYTDTNGEYSFPAWSDLTPGSYSVAIELPDFEHEAQRATLSEGKPDKINFRLKSKALAYEHATASEIVAALPGTDHQKTLLIQCDNCHTLQFALRSPRTREEWITVVKRMGGRSSDADDPGTYEFSQQQFIEPLADYLASIRGPGSSDTIPFKQRPRPTESRSTNLVVTEYALPRGGERQLYMLRGDTRFVWPHDVIMNDKYAYYTDHFSFVLGRLDLKTGVATEMPFALPSRAGRAQMADGRPGNPAGGAHELQFDLQGNVIIGMGGGIVKYDPKTGQFIGWPAGRNMFGLDPSGNAWFMQTNGELTKLDTSNEALKTTPYVVPMHKGIYDTDTDSKGRTYLYGWREDKIGVFDPKTLKYSEYKTPTPMSGPRRGQIDRQDRLWAAEYWAGQLLMLDADNNSIKEYPLLPGSKPYTPPYASPYTVSVDDKNQIVWTTDFNSNRLYRISVNTGESTEYVMPSDYEIRDLKVDTAAARPTVWIPVYRPPSKLVKIQLR